MTTLLNNKLSYALDSKEKIFQSLQKKGAMITEETPFRAYGDLIDSLKTSTPKQTILSGKNFPVNQKVMIQKHQNNLPIQNGGFHGVAKGVFASQSTNFALANENDLFFGLRDNYFYQYHYDETAGILEPVQKKQTAIKTSECFSNPVHKNLGSNYVFNKENDDPFTPLSYPSGGNFSSFNSTYSFFDSQGDFLIQYTYYNDLADILKYVYDEETNTYSYQLVQSFTHESNHNNSTFAIASGDVHTSNTFALGGKTIFKINKETNALSGVNIFDYNLPVSSGDILLFGQNYLIITSGYSSNTTLSFIKATPIDETLAANEEGFYDNPANYTYTLLHQEKPVYMPQTPLCYAKNNIYSPRKSHLNYFIHVEKERIDDINDFYYQLSDPTGLETYAVPINQNTWVVHAEKLSTTNYQTEKILCIYKRNSLKEPFISQQPLFQIPCHFLSELGIGVFQKDSSSFQFRIKNNMLDTTFINYASAYYFNMFMKNAHLFGTLRKDIFYGNYFLKGYNSIRLYGGLMAIVDEDFFSNTYQKQLLYFSDTGEYLTLTNPDLSSSAHSSLIFKYKGEMIFFNFGSQTGTNISGTSQKVSPNLDEKTFSVSEAQPATATLSSYNYEPLHRLKTKDLLISNTKLFGVKTLTDNTLHFQEIDFPPTLLDAFNGQTPYSVQTLYDGSVAFQLQNGITLCAHLDWDESSDSAHLVEGTQIETILPAITPPGEFYTFLSPFKVYKFIYNPTQNICHCTYTDPEKQETYFSHLEENKKENWNDTTLIGYVDENEKQDEQGFFTQSVRLEFE